MSRHKGATPSTDPVIAAAARDHLAAGLLGIAWLVEQTAASLGIREQMSDARGNGPFMAQVRRSGPQHRGNWSERADRSEARCVKWTGSAPVRCSDWYCPRHSPGAYSEAMARHATDSI